MNKKILIFYISRFSGHYHAASAIEQGIYEFSDSVDIEKINTFGYTNPILGKIINKAYMEVIKKRPELWGHIYDNPDVMNKTRKAREALHRFNKTKMKKLIEKKDPHAIFCTQAFPCGMVADYKNATGSNIPLIGVLTDYAPHSYWIYDEVDYYVVPSEETADVFIKKGVSSEKIKILGIPVDPKFREERAINDISGHLGFDPEKPVLLIMGGNQGLGAMEKVVNSLLFDDGHEYQLIVVTGANKKLFSRLKKVENNSGRGRIRVFSYVTNVQDLMQVSDVIISKAGGMSMAESLVKGLPVIIVSPIPGHEQMNADYLTDKGAAIEVKDIADIHDVVNSIFDSKEMISSMKKAAASLARPYSALEIAKLALKDTGV